MKSLEACRAVLEWWGRAGIYIGDAPRFVTLAREAVAETADPVGVCCGPNIWPPITREWAGKASIEAAIKNDPPVGG